MNPTGRERTGETEPSGAGVGFDVLGAEVGVGRCGRSAGRARAADRRRARGGDRRGDRLSRARGGVRRGVATTARNGWSVAVWSVRRSGIARAGRVTRSSIPMWWSRTRRRVRMVGGRRWMPATCTGRPAPPGSCTKPSCAHGLSARLGAALGTNGEGHRRPDRRARRACAASSPAAARRSKQRSDPTRRLARRVRRRCGPDPPRPRTSMPWSLHDDWVERAASARRSRPTVLQASAHPATARICARSFDPSRVSVTEVCAELTEHRSTFDRRHVLQALAGNAQTVRRSPSSRPQADRLLAGPGVVPLGVGRFGLCYSTPELLALEARILDQAEGTDDDEARCGRRPGRRRCSRTRNYPTSRARWSRRSRPTAPRSRSWSAPPGRARPTPSPRHARPGSDAGYTVIGCALAARAARQLQDDSQIPSVTLDRLLIDLDRPDTPSLTSRTVVVADEAAMIGTRKLARLLDHAHQAGAKVVLVGDPCQLPEIEAGGLFTGLAERLGAVGTRREPPPTRPGRTASPRRAPRRPGRRGDRTALRTRPRSSRPPTRKVALEQIVADWRAATRRRRRRDHARPPPQRRHRAQRHGPRRPRHRTGRRRLADPCPRPARTRSGIGSSLSTTTPAIGSSTANGARSPAANSTGSSSTSTAKTDRDSCPTRTSKPVTSTTRYAMTVHKAQGLTCDRAYVLGTDDLYAEAGYTALSRGRHENRLYVVADNEPDVDHHGAIEARRPDRRRPRRPVAKRTPRTRDPHDSAELPRTAPSPRRQIGTPQTLPPRTCPNTTTASTSAGKGPLPLARRLGSEVPSLR